MVMHVSLHKQDLNTVIDGIHALFNHWAKQRAFLDEKNANALQYLKLAVHEWVANLVQHAEFKGRTPDILISIHYDGQRLQCVIKDNSEGFDVSPYFCMDSYQRFTEMPDRGMGLMMIKTCAETVSYDRTSDWRHKMEFSVCSEPLRPVGAP